ncbi:unnamed protein product [Pieris macdunnoughi]|uniref:Uncharacterized protein n=1 Tax=Pieris macdunnoughi TaxID=345717 RepID=A0A821XMS4_9NEOP|nr:unnamed protein product [Pieris macdunnoughi]
MSYQRGFDSRTTRSHLVVTLNRIGMNRRLKKAARHPGNYGDALTAEKAVEFSTQKCRCRQPLSQLRLGQWVRILSGVLKRSINCMDVVQTVSLIVLLMHFIASIDCSADDHPR